MKSTLTLYGDATGATREAAQALSASGVAFTLTLFHDARITPMLGTPGGAIQGLQRIRLFAEKARVAAGEASTPVSGP
jgi:hypothetical protein